jgi:nitrogen-specific signal transduction histidine kinase
MQSKIDINLSLYDNSKIIEIIDNAGGIPEYLLPDIFKANVSIFHDIQKYFFFL